MPNDKISKITLPDGTTYDIQDTTYSAGTGLSLSDTVINHSNSVTAQTTQAIYPITIDAQGHIGSYGNAASIPTKTSDLTNDSGFITGMTILSYGNSTWANFIAAYDANKVVYCRASSNANPASGSQTRLAFMAYVNNATTPTEVEFQYYRSVSTHTESQQGDQVYVYKLNKNNGWSVTTREASVKVAYNNGITGTYSNGVMTLKHANTAITAQATQGLYPIKIDAYGHITGYGSEVTSLPASDVFSWAKASTKPSYTASEVGAVAISAVGAASGVAPLNASSKIDQAYLPSYVDDVIEGYYYNNKFYEEAAHTTEITGEAGKIYIDLSTDKTYRCGGSAYAEVGGGSLITISRNLTSGTKSATINIDGTSYDIYSVTNTDEKLKVAEVISGTTYYPVVSSNSTNAETKRIDSTGFNYSSSSGGTNNTGCSWLTLGNNIEIGNVGNKEGRIKLYGSHSGYVELYVDATMTADRILKLPNKSGTIALTTDIPSVPSWALTSTKPSYALSEITGASDVQAIEALSGTSGLLKKTAANTWTLDTTAYTTNTGTVTSITLKAGNGISLDTDNTAITSSGTRTISHADTSSQATVTADGRKYITGVTLDTYGHVTGLTTGTETVTDTHYTAYLRAGASGGTANAATTTGNTYLNLVENSTNRSGVKLVPGSNMTITSDANGNVTFAATNTTYSAGTGLSLSGTTFKVQNVPEAELTWGGKNFSASYGPIDAAMIEPLGANRFAFLKAAGLTIEYSTDGGSNWTDYGATDVQKTGLFGVGQSFVLGKHNTAGTNTVNDQLRVTIATSAAGIYTVLNKIAIFMSTSGNTVQVKIEKALESTPTSFNTHLDWTGISGQSGWNILNISGITTYGYSAASQYGRIRFVFRQTAVNTNYSSANISRIMGFGGAGWTIPSNMARDGHLYSYDNAQNAIFPAQVTATAFNGNATSATKATQDGSGNNIVNTYLTKAAGVTNVAWDSTNKKFTKTINGTTSDIVTIGTIKTALSLTKTDVGLGNVENKSSATIRGELTSSNVTTALGYTPYNVESVGKSLSSAGWYRVFTVNGTNHEILGIDGFAIDINLMRSSVNTAGETHKIRLSTPYNQFVFSNESSNSRVLGITKIRYTSSSSGGHIDIYYSLSNSDTVYIDFCVHVLTSKQGNFTAESLQAVADAPSGETVLTTYEFAANTSIVDVGSSGGVNHSYRRSGNVVVIGMVSPGGKSLSQNVYTTVATLPIGLRPLDMIDFAADNTGGTINIGGRIQLNGNIDLYPTNGSTSYWRFNVAYIV